MISFVLSLHRLGWKIVGISQISRCWLLERDGIQQRVPIPAGCVIP